MNTSNLVFVSFADSRMAAAIERIRKQAEEMEIFDEVHVWDEHNLDNSFRKNWAHVLKHGSRGFGYWCWKPYIIYKLLETLSDNSILVYCDIGCHLNPKGIDRFRYYLSELRNDPIGVKAFNSYYSHIDVLEKRWTKGDIFDYFQCRDNKDITDSKQIATGHIFIRKTPASVGLIKEWMEVWYQNFSLVDDSPSISPNFSEFIENRHDQSVFSVIYKLKGCKPFALTETDGEQYLRNENYPIWDLRDRGYKDKSVFSRIKRYIKAKLFMRKVKQQIEKQKAKQAEQE